MSVRCICGWSRVNIRIIRLFSKVNATVSEIHGLGTYIKQHLVVIF